MPKKKIKKLKRLSIVIYCLILVFSFSFYIKKAFAKTTTSGHFEMTYNETTFLKSAANLVPGNSKSWSFSVRNLGPGPDQLEFLVTGSGASSLLANKLNLKIKQGTNTLLSGTIKDLKDQQKVVDADIGAGESKNYILLVSFDSSADNSYQGKTANPVNFTFGFLEPPAPGGGIVPSGGLLGGGISFPFAFGGPTGTAGEIRDEEEEKIEEEVEEDGEVRGEADEEKAINPCWVWWVMLIAATVLIVLHYVIVWNKNLSLFWLTPLIIVVLALLVDRLAHQYLESTKWCSWLPYILLLEFLISGAIYLYFKKKVEEEA